MSWSLDTTNIGTYGTSNPSTVSLTLASTAKLLVVFIYVNGTTARTGGAPTWAGQTLSDSGQGFVFDTGGECGIEIWYRINPTTGSNSVSVPNTGAINIDVSAYSFIPSAGACAFDTSNKASGTTQNPSLNLTSVTANALAVGGLGSGDRDVPTAGTNYTLVYTYDAGNQTWGDEYDLDVGGGGTVAVSFGTARSDDWGLIGVAFREVTSTPASSNKPAFLKGSTTTSDNQYAYLKGSLDTSDNQAGNLTGGIESSDNQYAYLQGQDVISDNQSAYSGGSLDTSDNQSAYLGGGIETSDNQYAYSQGQDTTSDNQTAYLTGNISISDGQAAFTQGPGTPVSDNQYAYLDGALGSSDNQAAFIAGQSVFALRPDSDITVGGWVNEVSSTPLWSSIDELYAVDTDYVWHSGPIVGDYFEVSLTDPGGYVAPNNHYIRWRAKRIGGTLTTTVKCELRQGSSTVIASDEQTLTDAYQTFEKALTGPEIANITNYNDLRYRFTVTGLT